MDCNHDDDGIDNLMVMPRGLHSGYRPLKACVLGLEDPDYGIKSLGHARWHRKAASESWDCHRECCKRYGFKMSPDGMPYRSSKGIDLSGIEWSG